MYQKTHESLIQMSHVSWQSLIPQALVYLLWPLSVLIHYVWTPARETLQLVRYVC